MTEAVVYERARIDPFSGIERCRAKRTTTRTGAFGRCANRARTSEGGLCWRHR